MLRRRDLAGRVDALRERAGESSSEDRRASPTGHRPPHLRVKVITADNESSPATPSASWAYISRQKYYKLGAFVRDAGLARRDAGNLYLLSFAANFKVKSLQRAFLKMVAAGFRPDLTTLNIRAAGCLLQVCMFWDLHLTADHLRRDGVAPNLVTRTWSAGSPGTFAFDRLDGNAEPVVATDVVIFEAFGKVASTR